jgi:hypothetical protein
MATITPSYAAYATITISPASLATSATAGRQSTEIDNTTNKYDNVRITGKVTVGTTPTVNTQILIYALGRLDNTATYPDAFGASDAARTIRSVGNARGYLKLGAALEVDATTSDRAYEFDFELAQLFGGVVPDFWTLWVVHNTGVNLNATGGNHVFKYMGIKYDVA